MVANFLSGGAAINVLARHAGAEVVVVDVGVASPLDDHPALIHAKVRAGTGNIAVEDAMTEAEAQAALDVGADLATRLVNDGARCLVTGDMGIGNTTPSAALIAALTGHSPEEVTGRGTGIDDQMLATKVGVVTRALARTGDRQTLGTLASLGGLEIAALAGFVIGWSRRRRAGDHRWRDCRAALLVAAELVPECVGYAVPGHRSTEPGATAVLQHLNLQPLLDLDLRLGEGSGACLALPVLQASAKILREMATFDGAGVTEK